jgi:hypothetical protein
VANNASVSHNTNQFGAPDAASGEPFHLPSRSSRTDDAQLDAEPVATDYYSTHGLGNGFVVGIPATIGYDVDWRTVHKLLLDGATRTEQIATEPVPRVLEKSFGNYSVEYELRPWTKTSEGVFETYAALRRNVLDAFADAGVEIMTPTILSHRDASELAVPTERFPNRPRPRGIKVEVDPRNHEGDSRSL